EDWRLAGPQRAEADDAEADVVLFRDGPLRAVDGDHVGHVTEPALARDHDGAHLGELALRPAGVPPPVDGVAAPGHRPLRRHPPGAVAAREVVDRPSTVDPMGAGWRRVTWACPRRQRVGLERDLLLKLANALVLLRELDVLVGAGLERRVALG